MSSVMDAGPCVRTNQLDFDDEVIYKARQYLYDHARQRGDQPFCLTVSMTHPHDPYAMTQEYWDLYEDVDIPLPTTPAMPQEHQDEHSKRVLKIIDLWGKEIPEERIKAARRAYFAACSYVDDQIGKLMATLKNCGFADNTIVVFSGDHGDMLGERGLWYKMVWYEHSARVPMIIHAPGKYAPKRVKENVSTMDLLPTFVAMSGGSLVPDLPLDGVSLMPHLDENSTDPKSDTVFGEYMGEGTLAPTVMIRRGPWKFVYCPLDPPMLYNVEEDPQELNNLAAGIKLPLHRAKPAVQTAVDGPAALPTPDLSPAQTPFFSQPPNGVLPTPPRSPSPPKHLPSLASVTSSKGNDVTSVFASFIAEVHARWDFDALQKQVLHSQRRRRLVYSALSKGTVTPWDFQPMTAASTQFIRNQGQGALGNVEQISRWPRVEGAIVGVQGREVQYRP